MKTRPSTRLLAGRAPFASHVSQLALPSAIALVLAKDQITIGTYTKELQRTRKPARFITRFCTQFGARSLTCQITGVFFASPIKRVVYVRRFCFVRSRGRGRCEAFLLLWIERSAVTFVETQFLPQATHTAVWKSICVLRKRSTLTNFIHANKKVLPLKT